MALAMVGLDLARCIRRGRGEYGIVSNQENTVVASLRCCHSVSPKGVKMTLTQQGSVRFTTVVCFAVIPGAW